MNPGIARLAIIIALIVGGVAVLANGFSEEGAAAPPDDSSTPSPTGTPSPTRTPQASVVPQQDGVLIQVLNGTSAAGYRYYERWLAALERTVLEGGLVDASHVAASREALEREWAHDHRHDH